MTPSLFYSCRHCDYQGFDPATRKGRHYCAMCGYIVKAAPPPQLSQEEIDAMDLHEEERGQS